MASSLTPRQGPAFGHRRSTSSKDEDDTRNGLMPPPSRQMKDARSMSNLNTFGPRTASLANAAANGPGSFSSTLTKTNNARVPLRPELTSYSVVADALSDEVTASERRQAGYRDKINKEMKIKVGAENMLAALLSKNPKQTKDQRMRAESEISSSKNKIATLETQLQEEIERSKRAAAPPQNRLSQIFRGGPLRSPSRQSRPEEQQEDEDEASPTYLLSETLQELEQEDRQPDYYVHRANGIAELFKRNPTLKYDLAWSIFGLRVQTMMLSDSKEVAAAGYRVTRHAFADRKSLQTVRSLQTDALVIVSLAKDSKARIEREQALKFIRAFLDVKDGIKELSNAVVRAVVSVAEHYEDHLRHVAILTLAEILIRDPILLVRAGGITTLYEALKDGSYPGSESLVSTFLYLTDAPKLRKLITPGYELAGPFGLFSDSLPVHGYEERMKSNIKSISAILNSWPGLFALSYNGFSSVLSLVMALSYPSQVSRNLILDLIFETLHIEQPSWMSSFLAGRRLTTYGRVANLRGDPMTHQSRLEDEDDLNRANLIDHYTALLLLIFVNCGLVEALTELTEDLDDMTLHRKTTLLLSEVLKLADHALPTNISSKLHALPEIMRTDPTNDSDSDTPIPSRMAFQMDTVNRTMHRTQNAKAPSGVHGRNRSRSDSNAATGLNDAKKTNLNYDMDEITFRSKMAESQVVGSPNYLKWKWDLISDIIEGPLHNPKRLEDAKSTKFMKRLLGFYRPFKFRFSESRNTKPNQRYVRTGCALMKCLLASSEGIQLLAEHKLLRQLAECLAQIDRFSGITAASPLFSQDRIRDTLTGGYFALLGALTSDTRGLQIMARWRMFNMFYHIIDLHDREDVVQLLLENMDFTIDSHLRVLISKALTAGPKSIRTFATKLLRKYATQEIEPGGNGAASNAACWAIRLLVTQLYDPDVEVSEVAVQILQEACNRKQYLEYVVKCRPALDHLGEIGAPLLLRFLSTSLGYEYLHDLDYITQEMDDWFLGRNEKYVTQVEASLSRGFAYELERAGKPLNDELTRQQLGVVPPHFYRELSRTKEGCKLLSESGHFEEFVSTIKDFWAEDEDHETMLKVKGCLWAVGNVGSMELGAPFLERSNVVEWIIKIVECSGVMTMRGTAFFVLGLISRSWHGMEILAEKGWDAATNHLGQSLGYILPPSLDVLFPEQPKAPQRLPPPLVTLKEMPPPVDRDDPVEKRIYASVIEAGNTVLSRKAINDINLTKSKKPRYFRSVPIFIRVLHIFECHAIKLPIRQRIIDMFAKEVMRKLVLEYNDDDDDDDNDEDDDD